ncbi:MAG: hypothetical protein LVR00_09315 [Rhabdochlamydiaceae bacterium]|jgi:hypothetical protein
MKLRLLIILSCFCFSFTKEGDEIAVITELLERTDRQLSFQKQLKELMVALNDQEKTFLAGNESKTHVSLMTETALQILKLIEDNHYADLFPSPYMEELRLFAKIANKKSPTKP